MTEDAPVPICPGCGLRLPDSGESPPGRRNASAGCLRAYSDILCYTVAKQDPAFIHQHAVDAYAAQHAGSPTRKIAFAFGLIGLYLALEQGFTGKQAQQAHGLIAKIRKDWPRLEPPLRPAPVTVRDVLEASEGSEKDARIQQWMAAVWASWADRQPWVRETADALLARGRS